MEKNKEENKKNRSVFSEGEKYKDFKQEILKNKEKNRPYWESCFNPSEEDKKMTDDELKAKVNKLNNIGDEIHEIMRNSPLPYSLDICNKTNKSKKAILFGSKMFLLEENYGSEEGVEITTAVSNTEYGEILRQFKEQPTKMGVIRLVSSNLTQLKEPISVVSFNDNDDNEITDVIETKDFLSPQAFQSQFNEILYKYTQDGNKYFTFNILPNTTLGFRLYEDRDKESKDDLILNDSTLHESLSDDLTPNPLQVSITNTTNETKNAILFNFDEYFGDKDTNYGSDEGIVITPSQNNVSYKKLLAQSALKPFKTSLIRIQSANSSQVRRTIEMTTINANGQQATSPLFVETYFSINQFQSGIVDIPVNYIQDGSTELKISILSKTTLVVTLFPYSEVNLSNWLRGDEKALMLTQSQFEQIMARLGRSEDRVKELESKKWWQSNKPLKNKVKNKVKIHA